MLVLTPGASGPVGHTNLGHAYLRAGVKVGLEGESSGWLGWSSVESSQAQVGCCCSCEFVVQHWRDLTRLPSRPATPRSRSTQ